MLRRTVSLIFVGSFMLGAISCESQTATQPRIPAENGTRHDPDSGAVDHRISQVSRELESLANHNWAGRYYSGDGLGVSLSLCMAPKSGAAVQWNGCLGLYDQNHGDLQETDGRIRVAWALPTNERMYKSDDFLAVQWGQRHYLIKTEDILEFCSAVRSGKEPRKDVHGMFYLRHGDERLPVDGNPKLPKGFEKYLRMISIDAKIKAIGKTSVRISPEAENREEVTQDVTLNVGAAEGVLQKMRFKIMKPEIVWAVVLKVAEHESEAEVTYWQEKGEKRALTSDWELSSPIF